MLEGTRAALARNDGILAKIDEMLSRSQPLKREHKAALLAMRAEMKSHRPGLLESQADAMKP